MLFTTGNLITLGIVLVVLLVYRQLDRDNRTLEKVKKFADRQRDELSAYVDKRAEDLRRFGIELDVQAEGRQGGSRPHPGRPGRHSREGRGDRRHREAPGRVRHGPCAPQGHDRPRGREPPAASTRSRSSSTRSPSASTRRRRTSSSSSAILPALRAGFAKDAGAALHAFKAEILADVGKRVAELGQVADKAREEAQAAASSVESGKTAFERELQRGLERARVEAEKLEDLAFAKLKEGTDAKAARLKELIEERFAQLAALAKEKTTETQSLIKGFKAEWKSEADDLLERGRKEAEEAASALASALDRTRAELESRLDGDAEALESRLDGDAKALESRLAATTASLNASLAEGASSLKRGLDAASSSLGAELKSSSEGLRAQLADAKGELDSFRARWKSEAAELLSTRLAEAEALAAPLRSSLAEVEARIGQLREGTEVLVAGFREKWKAEAEGLLSKEREDIAQAAAGLRASLEVSQKELRDSLGAAEADLGAKLESDSERMEGRLAETAAVLGQGIEEAEKRVAASAASVAMTEKSVAELAARSSGELAAIAAQARVDTRGPGRQDQERPRLVEARLAAEGAALQAKVFEEFGRRLAEYASEAEARFERLEAAGAEIGGLDQALRASMDQAERRVESDFEAFGRELEDRRKRFEEASSARPPPCASGMKALEEELDALKTRAYDNVSEKLKVFEDEFFVDLKARGESVERRLEAWRADLDKTLSDLAASAAAERAAAEKASVEEMRARIADNQARVQEQLDKLRERAQAVQDGIVAQSGMAAESLAALKESVLKDAADARATAQAYVEGEISRFYPRGRRQAQGRRARPRGPRRGPLRRRSPPRRRARAPRPRGGRRGRRVLPRALRRVGRRPPRPRPAPSSTPSPPPPPPSSSASRADYEAQSDSYAASSQAERDRISRELAGLADRTAELRADLSSRIAQALEGFSRGFEAFAADLEKKRREAQAEGEPQAARVQGRGPGPRRSSSRPSAPRPSARSRPRPSRIAQAVAEIDRQQKAFVAQTKLFERTDELKESLAASIESMKADLARLEGRRAEVAEIEGQLGRGQAPRGRGQPEGHALPRREEAHRRPRGRLHEARRRLRVRGPQARGGHRPGRRPHRGPGHDTQAPRAVQGGRGQVRAARQEVGRPRRDGRGGGQELPVRAGGGEGRRGGGRRAAQDTRARRRAQARRRRAGGGQGQGRARRWASSAELDGVIADAEKRIAEVQKAREWLARAETRLEEIDRKAQEQLKLLSSILKDEEGGARRRARAPRPRAPRTRCASSRARAGTSTRSRGRSRSAAARSSSSSSWAPSPRCPALQNAGSCARSAWNGAKS